MYMHLTTSTIGGEALFADRELAEWTWRHMRRLWPDALGGTMMGNHLHAVIEGEDPALEVRRLDGLLAQIGPLLDIAWPLWKPTPPPKLLTSPSKIRAELAYLWLNPCRAGLCDDPLRWGWSSYRELFGAVYDPWVPVDRVSDALGSRWHGLHELHAFVTSDKHVSPIGTPPPTPALPASWPELGLGILVAAALAATRGGPGAVRRRGPARRAFLLLAGDQGWRDARVLAEVCEVCPAAVRRTWERPRPGDAELLDAARLCLGDPRLRSPAFPPARISRADRPPTPPP